MNTTAATRPTDRLTADNCAVLLIDYQTGTMRGNTVRRAL